MYSTLSRRTLTGAAAVALLANGVLVGTAGAAEPPDLRSRLVVAAGSYLPGDLVQLKLIVTNAGGLATGVRGEDLSTSATVENPAQWRDLDPQGPGGSFQPGESRVYALQVRLGPDNGQAHVLLGALAPGDANPGDNRAERLLPVSTPEKKVAVGGLVFGDADQDGRASDGEALAGATVTLSSRTGGEQRTATTGADGRYTFTEVPAGNHTVRLAGLPGGWGSSDQQDLRLDGSVPQVQVPLRALRPLAESLRATGSLDGTSYTAGQQAAVTVGLTNTGSVALRGIYLACDRAGNGLDLDIPAAAWGELSANGPGATVEPGQTKAFTARGVVRAKSGEHGYVEQHCELAQVEGPVLAEPGLRSHAKVTGQTGSLGGQLYHDVNGNEQVDAGEGLANQEVRLTDVHNGHEFTARTSAEGRVALSGPAGRYRIAVPGWTSPGYAEEMDLLASGGDFGERQMRPAG